MRNLSNPVQPRVSNHSSNMGSHLVPSSSCFSSAAHAPTSTAFLLPSLPSPSPLPALALLRPRPARTPSSRSSSRSLMRGSYMMAVEPPRPGSVSADGKAQKASFYKRPSKAIEMGGGFFIPGLEGYKLRLATAVVVLVLLGLNRYPGYDVAPSQATSEVIGAGAAVILLAQALIEKLITDAGARGDEDEEEAADVGSGRGVASSSSPLPPSMLEEECVGVTDSKVEDDLRWAGYALDENLGCPAVAVLHGEKGLVYYRRKPSRNSNPPPASSSSSSAAADLAKAMLLSLPKSTRRAMGMGDALAALGGVGGSSGAQLASSLGLRSAEGVVVVRVGSNALLAVAPPPGGIMRDQAVWVERAGALLEGSGIGS